MIYSLSKDAAEQRAKARELKKNPVIKPVYGVNDSSKNVEAAVLAEAPVKPKPVAKKPAAKKRMEQRLRNN